MASSIRFATPQPGQLSIRFTIDSFSLDDTARGLALESAEQKLAVGGGAFCSFSLHVYPRDDRDDAMTTDDDLSIGVFLNLKQSNCLPITCKVRIEIAGGATKRLHKLFDKCPTAYGFPDFVSRHTVLGNPKRFLTDDKLTVIAKGTVAYYGESLCMPRLRLNASVDALQLFQTGRYSDCSIRCRIHPSDPRRSEEIAAHRFVLCSLSSVFDKKFKSRSIMDVYRYSVKTMRCFIRLLYGGSIGRAEILAEAEDLLQLSQEFDVDDLKTQLDAFLAHSGPLSASDVVRLLPSADCNGAYKLRSACLDAFKTNPVAILAHKHFQPSLLTDDTLKEMLAVQKVNGAIGILQSFDSELFPDCRIRVVESAEAKEKRVLEEFGAHRLVLIARSDVFRAMFEDGTIEANRKEINVDDVEPNGMRLFLKALYGKTLTVDELGGGGDDDADRLMPAESVLHVAKKYAVRDIVAECERHLMQSIELGNVFRLLRLADRYSTPKLKRACVDFIQENRHDAVRHTTFANSELGNSLLTELFLAAPQ